MASVPSGRSVRTVGFFTDGHGQGRGVPIPASCAALSRALAPGRVPRLAAPGVPGGRQGVCVPTCCRGGAWWMEGFREIHGPRAAGVVARPAALREAWRHGMRIAVPRAGRPAVAGAAPRVARTDGHAGSARLRGCLGITPMYLRTAFVYPGAPYVLHGCRENWLRGSDSSPGARTWETGRAARPGNGGAICAARHVAWHEQQQPNRGDIAIKPTASGFVPADYGSAALFLASPLLLAHSRPYQRRYATDMQEIIPGNDGCCQPVPGHPSEHGANTEIARSRPL